MPLPDDPDAALAVVGDARWASRRAAADRHAAHAAARRAGGPPHHRAPAGAARGRRGRRDDDDDFRPRVDLTGEERRLYEEGRREAASRDADAAAAWTATDPPRGSGTAHAVRAFERLALLQADADMDLPTRPGAPPTVAPPLTRDSVAATLADLRPSLAPALGLATDAAWEAATAGAVDAALAAAAASAPRDAAADAAAVAAAAAVPGADAATAAAVAAAVASLNANPHWPAAVKVRFAARLARTLGGGGRGGGPV